MWFTADMWMVTCIILERKRLDRSEESILTKYILVLCDHLFDLVL